MTARKDKIRVDESQMTQYDPLLKWEDHNVRHSLCQSSGQLIQPPYAKAVWKMQYRGSLGEALIHILIMGNSLIHTKIARTLIRSVPNLATKSPVILRHFPRCAIDIIEVIPLSFFPSPPVFDYTVLDPTFPSSKL